MDKHVIVFLFTIFTLFDKKSRIKEVVLRFLQICYIIEHNLFNRNKMDNLSFWE